MKFLVLLLLGFLYCLQIVGGQLKSKRLVCYYDVLNHIYQGYPYEFETHLMKALPNCTHLVYGYAQILPQTFQIRKFKLSPQPSNLKVHFPHLKIFLSLGGDKLHTTQQYLKFLEAGTLRQQHFIEHVRNFLKVNYFDGLDLAFPFPCNKPRKVHNGFGAVVKNIKKLFAGKEVVDPKADQHKIQYTNFVSGLRNQFVKANLELSMTVLPNVNSSWYFDIFKIHKNFEFINLFAFDFLTPLRNPEEADYSAPIYFKEGANRLKHYNIEFQVDHWIHNGCPADKLNLGISTYGRAWKLTTSSGLSGVPVVESTNGAAEPGKFSKIPGFLSWPEICIKLTTKGFLQRVVDIEHKYGSYAFSPADRNGNNGLWISFDDPKFAGIKTDYVLQKGMGGVAVYDLQNDDFLKFCKGPAFPILSRISEGLGILHTVHKHFVESPGFIYDNYLFPKYA